MINETNEFTNTPEEIMRLAVERGIKDKPSDEALAAIVAFFDVADDDREWVLRVIRNFTCSTCGKASCLHGYPC